jgi:hypothetical protein
MCTLGGNDLNDCQLFVPPVICWQLFVPPVICWQLFVPPLDLPIREITFLSSFEVYLNVYVQVSLCL